MAYSHKTNHSFEPPIDFWRTIENLFISFPMWTGKNKWISNIEFITFYEKENHESFDVEDSDLDIYGNEITELYVPRGSRDILLKNLPEEQRKSVGVGARINYVGKVINFLSKSISNPVTIHKFQHFFESAYRYLKNIHNLDPNNPEIRSHGLGNKNNPIYERLKENFINDVINNERRLIRLIDFKDYFNSVCRKHKVPFVMFTQDDECYVVHTTDIFIEKEILDIPVFLRDNNLKQANDYFVKAVNERDKGNCKESLNNLRQALEDIRDEIYKKYNLGNTSISLHNDLKKLFENESCRNQVFEFSKIPQLDKKKLENIISKLKESLLLAVKMTNIGSHKSSVPELIEENTTLFALGLVASIFPYLYYLMN